MASDFIKEKIKDRPVDKKRLARQIGLTAVIAVVFGVVSAVTFSLVYAHIKPSSDDSVKPVELNAQENEPEASISEDLTATEEALESNDDPDHTGAGASFVSGNSTEQKSDNPGENKRTTIINSITNNVDISPEGYSKLYKELHSVAADASSALAIVTATTTDTDWFENPYKSGNSVTGLIIADNGRQLLILVDGSATKSAEEIRVRFPDGTGAVAKILNTDPDTSLQIIGVEMSDIDEDTIKKISYANLGSSSPSSMVGTPVIAIGEPLGIIGSEAHGIITSASQEKEMSDFNVHLLTTDIPESENSSGVIIDYSGNVLGIISDGSEVETLKDMITVYSISDIKDTIENLANGRTRAYLGIIGTSVTDEAADEYGVPMGAYVINVDQDSPAMASGIQSGDVITKIGTEVIEDYDDYTTALSQLDSDVETVVTVQRFSRGKYTELTFETELSRK